jgi:hypothetical protein
VRAGCLRAGSGGWAVAVGGEGDGGTLNGDD